MGDEDWEDYESGPYCRHWNITYECDDRCATCGHLCIAHSDFECEPDSETCPCREFVDAHAKPT